MYNRTMFNLGLGELVAIFVVALIFWGPNALPEIGKLLGRAVRMVKDLAGNFREELGGSVKELDELKSTVDDLRDPVSAFTRELVGTASYKNESSFRNPKNIKDLNDTDRRLDNSRRKARIPEDEDDYLSMLVEREYAEEGVSNGTDATSFRVALNTAVDDASDDDYLSGNADQRRPGANG